jgi:hypothetical protein
MEKRFMKMNLAIISIILMVLNPTIHLVHQIVGLLALPLGILMAILPIITLWMLMVLFR